MKKINILLIVSALLIVVEKSEANYLPYVNSLKQNFLASFDPVIVLNPVDTLDCSDYDFENFEWLPYQIEAEVLNSTQIQWITSGDGTFDNPTIANPLYFIGKNDLLNNSVTLQITATDNTTTVSANLNLIIPLQVIQIDKQGWTGLSSYIDKSDTPVPEVMAPVVENLVIMWNEEGSYYWTEPIPPINQLGNWSAVGYKANFINPPACMPLFGNPVTDQTYTIDGSFVYLPVLTDYPVNIEELLGENIDKVFTIFDYKDSLQWTPANPAFDYLKPGLAYLVMPNQGESFTVEFPPYSWENQVSIQPIYKMEIGVFPNPSNAIFNVKLADKFQNSEYEVVNMQGLTLLKGRADIIFSINVSSYPKGLYYLILSHGGLQSVKKLMLK